MRKRERKRRETNKLKQLSASPELKPEYSSCIQECSHGTDDVISCPECPIFFDYFSQDYINFTRYDSDNS